MRNIQSIFKTHKQSLISAFSIYLTVPLTLFRMGLFGATQGWGEQKGPLSKLCHTYPTLMKLGTVIP